MFCALILMPIFLSLSKILVETLIASIASIMISDAPHADLCISSKGEFVAYSAMRTGIFAVGWEKKF